MLDWWNNQIAQYVLFPNVAILFTILQEYPYHLLQLKDTTRLEEFLGDFKVFDKLYDRDYSPKLILYWKEVHMYQLFLAET